MTKVILLAAILIRKINASDLLRAPMTLRVVAADDNSRFLQTIISELEAASFEVVETASDGRSALECVLRNKPDVIVLDLIMPGLNGIEVTRELRKNGIAAAIIICSVESDEQTIDAAREAGAQGYVFKTRMAKDLVPAVRAVSSGEVFISSR